MNNREEVIEQSMLAQRVYLDLVRSRHLLWAHKTDDPEVKRVHIEIADLIQQTRDQYYDLLHRYHEHIG
jgi:hypothetical protein